jgi:integrase
VLVQSHRHRTLKTPAARRQVPLLFSLTEQEHLIIDRFLALWEGLSGGNRRVPLFTSSDDASRLLNERLLRWHASQLIKRATLNPNLSLHHARHSFANRVALMLMDRTEGIWPFAAEFDATQNTHVRRLLLCTDQVTRRSLWALARLLGHAHPQTSVRSYLHLLPELADQHVWADAPRSARSVAWDVPGMVQLERLAPMAGYLNAQERPE